MLAEGVLAIKLTLPPFKFKGEVMASVLLSAWVEDREQVETPLAFVAEQLP